MFTIKLIILFLICTSVNLLIVKKPLKFLTDLRHKINFSNISDKKISTTTNNPSSLNLTNSTDGSNSKEIISSFDHLDVAVKIYNKIVHGKTENIFISPFSIINSLVLCYFGSRNETANQLKQFLNFKNVSDIQIKDLFSKRMAKTKSSSKLNQANRFFINQDIEINSNFKTVLNKNFQSKYQLKQQNLNNSIKDFYFKADIITLNISNIETTVEEMNKWIKDQTRDQIDDIISFKHLVNSNSAIFLTGSFFSGRWLHKFSIFNTNLIDFRLRDGTTRKIQMMRSFNEKFKVLNLNFAGLGAISCEFPYADYLYSMTIIVPKESIDIQIVEASLTTQILNKIIKYDSEPSSVNVFLPKFKITSHFDLSHYASELGIPLLFDKYESNLNGISESVNKTENLFISKFIYKSVIEINELGTDAVTIPKLEAAFPVSLVSNVSLEFKCNKPFLFFIHSKNDILLIGKYTGVD